MKMGFDCWFYSLSSFFFPYLFTKKVLGHVLQFLNFFLKKILEKTFFISFKIEKLKKNLKNFYNIEKRGLGINSTKQDS